jgi:hypothetical protein
MTEELTQLGIRDDNRHALSNDTSENRNLVAQTPEFDIGEISVNPPNDSFREQVWKLCRCNSFTGGLDDIGSDP